MLLVALHVNAVASREMLFAPCDADGQTCGCVHEMAAFVTGRHLDAGHPLALRQRTRWEKKSDFASVVKVSCV